MKSPLFCNVIQRRLIGYSETSVNNNQSTLCNIPKERISYCNESWKDLFPVRNLTLKLLTTTIVAPPSNASKWQMEFNSAFKGLKLCSKHTQQL